MSYSYQVALCQPHADAIAGDAPWVCRNQDGGSTGGWEVLMGDDIALLDEYEMAGTPEPSSGNTQWRASEGLVPNGWQISLPLKKIGSEDIATIRLRLTPEQARSLRQDLQYLARE